jgi:Phage tail protein (Tail_P2_I)
MTQLLPPNASSLERSIEATQIRLSPARIVPTLWNAATCPANLLPWLAWSSSVDYWNTRWTEAEQRAAISASADIHRHKGTPYAIKLALTIHGHPDAILVERADSIRYDGQAMYNGYHRYGSPARWATYKVILKRPIMTTQAELLKSMLASITRNCCHLVSLDYTHSPLRYTGYAQFNGLYTHGTIN